MGAGGQIQVALLYNKGNEKSVALSKTFEEAVRNSMKSIPAKEVDKTMCGGFAKFKHFDIHEPFVHCDVNVHLDFPVYGACPWAFTNIAVKRDGSGAWHDNFDKIVAMEGIFDAVIAEADGFDNVDMIVQLLCSIVERVQRRRPKHGVFHCPPILTVEDCPNISIVTPTYGRRDMIDIAFHNILSTDYPLGRIEWVIVEDNEQSDAMASDKIVNFQMNCPQITMKYIPIQGRMTIGEKRNIGVENSTHDIILFMDDDDHYPVTSFRRRVAWLLKGSLGEREGVGADVSVCTTIALYDLKRGVSAVNVPPWHLPLSQRISEATLTFRKSFWLERKFPNISMSEGEEWLAGREGRVIEVPPQQAIVAFSHDGNASRRRIPPTDAQVSCFWGFPKEYLIFIHKLAGVTLEEDTSPRKVGRKV